MDSKLTELLAAIQQAKELFPEITKDGDLQQVVKSQITARFALPAPSAPPVSTGDAFALLPAEAVTANLDDFKEEDFVFAEDHFLARYGHAPNQSANFYKALKNMFLGEFGQLPFQKKRKVNPWREADTNQYPVTWLNGALDKLRTSVPVHWEVA